ncbi:hypothetical protein RHSIM_Rhsim12G0206300 [Rhododendron simsii]|uniref:LOB domain-containing protein n=1 Tax=Rhododendron simsii TaxID=118357 RepID=A0A834L941_RHOSS|nr:hypothetical protein RHSIM_Rhsim12G0206300 [Rhododendron simsii]
MTNPTTKANATSACAACKYQRRKCAPDCILAPYFPNDRQRQFLNAHKLFGVSNITKIIRSLDPPQKDQAMRTIVFQSDVRANDPVGGCYRIIRELQRQIEYNRAELVLVLQQLAICRAQIAAAVAQQYEITTLPHGIEDSSTVKCEAYNPMSNDRIEEPHEDEYLLHDENHIGQLQDIVAWAMQDTASSSVHDKQTNLVKECDDIKPTVFDIGDERLDLKFDYEIENSDEDVSKDEKAIVKDEIASFISNDDDKARLDERS